MPHSATVGLAARSPTYMRAHWDHAKGFHDDDALAAARTTEGRRFLAAATAAGIDRPGPAATGWEDLLRPLANVAGASPGALTRYFETNTFFRTPVVTGELGSAKAAVADLVVPKDWALTVPSPWDFAMRAEDHHYGSPAQLALGAAAALRPLVQAAVKKGASHVFVFEPSLAYARAPVRDLDAARAAYAALARGIEAEFVLHLQNGDPFATQAVEASPFGVALEDPGRPVDADVDGLWAAFVRGEESLLEEPADVARRADAFAAHLGTPLAGICNGWPLEHLPAERAEAKLAIIAQAAKTVEVTA